VPKTHLQTLTLEKSLILYDEFLELSLKTESFSQRMLNGAMRNDYPFIDYFMTLLRRGQMHLFSLLIY